jgi:transposase
MTGRCCLGVDVSKAELVWTLVDGERQRRTWTKTTANTRAGVAQVLAKVHPEVPWVLEPTGAYSEPVARQAVERGRCALLAPSRGARDFARSRTTRAKNDRVDSETLAWYGLSQPLRPYPLTSAPVKHVEQLLTVRRGLSKSLTRLTQQAEALPALRELLAPALVALRQQVALTDRAIARAMRDEPAFAVARELDKVPGIGPVTAAAMTACLVKGQFARAEAVVAYIGLDLTVHDSGDRVSRRRLTKQGDAELRRLLYVCAQASLRCKDGPFLAQYQREQAKGLSTTQALCAIARKLAMLCWSIYRHGTTYDPTRVYRQPNPRPEECHGHQP